MPKATAVWLLENTSLSFDQIADFCELHPLEVQGMADGEVAKGIAGIDPVASGQVSRAELTACEQNHHRRLQISDSMLRLAKEQTKQQKRSKYTPIARRQDKPDAIAWLLKHCAEMTDVQIIKLIGTTKAMINAVRDKSHWNSANIRPKDPVLLGLTAQSELDRVYAIAKEKHGENQDKERQESSDVVDGLLKEIRN